MRVLVIGGAGRVASYVIPHLKEWHDLRIYDLKPPADASLAHVIGSVTDYDALLAAAAGVDALLYMAMGSLAWQTIEGAQTAFDANVKGVYLALKAVREASLAREGRDAGAAHAVYCSTMSVYDGDLMKRHFFDEDMPPDARGLYGFTKRLGEETCRNAWYEHGMSVNALRLCMPTPDDRWLAEAKAGVPAIATAASDLARAFDSALRYRNGFQAFMISGDFENKIMNMGKAKRLLEWEPLARPRGAA